eukprot:CAMPEP_0185812392 /NCGR_PEP_ID=MMETSP1322-20130828/9291_1 /TAXON_ID=265543 /ORGANISM="Minutocellus polymorphus, Strain RCC2270" /LENGTH=204 /DNA_ID=CAMNT_0028508925 /DNA_START=38 /DNA_END=653 /DNA_ORIENTATION=-
MFLRYRLAFFLLPAATLVAAEVLEFDDYQVPYQTAQVGRCKLASADEAYEYSILAEDYLVQTNLVATIGADNPDAYYEENIAPRQASNFEVVAPSVGLELSGDDVRQLFLNLSTEGSRTTYGPCLGYAFTPMDGRASISERREMSKTATTARALELSFACSRPYGSISPDGKKCDAWSASATKHFLAMKSLMEMRLSKNDWNEN